MSPTASASLTDNLRGATFMTAGMAGFAANDTIVKAFSGELNIGQLVLIRGIVASSLLFLLAWKLGHLRPIRFFMRAPIVLRSLAEISATYLYLNALFHIPIANAAAIMQALPLALTFFAPLILGETFGWRRLTAIVIGFVGVLIIIRPGPNGFDSYSVYALAAMAACVVRDLVTRKLDAGIPALFIALSASVAVTLLGAGLSSFETWKPVTAAHLGLLTLSSLFLMCGYFFVVSSMRLGDIGFVSPFRYAILLFSIFGGMIFFAEYPDPMTWLGSAIVVATGIYTLYRESVVNRQEITPAVPLRG